MPDTAVPETVQVTSAANGAVCVHTNKIFDSCRAKDCIEDLRLYPTEASQTYIETAVSVRSRSAQLLYADIDVEEMNFNRGYYTVDIRYYYKITGSAYSLTGSPAEIVGLCVFDKRTMLFGSESSAKVFTSASDGLPAVNGGVPTAVLEAVDPILLNMKLVDGADIPGGEATVAELPPFITDSFDGDLVLDDGGRRIYVSLGQFSTLRLERGTQLTIPYRDYCMPDKECIGTGEDDPCTLFANINFPTDEFFPPDTVSLPEGYREAKNTL